LTPKPDSRSLGRTAVVTDRPAPAGFALRSPWALGGLLAASLLLQSVIYAPISLWPVAYVALVPWILVIGASVHARRVYVASYLLGLAFFLLNLTWIYPITAAGYVALCAYLAVYYPLAACPIRHAVRRRGVPLVVAFPVIWVGSEYLRSVVMTGFPWFLLSHSHYRVLSLVQVSDLVGAYGVSFVIAMVNGALTDLAFAQWRARRTQARGARRRFAPGSVVAAAVVMVATIGYGQVQLHRDTTRPGPRVAVIQGDYPLRVSGEGEHPVVKAGRYFELLRRAASRQPDLFLLPETPWSMLLNAEFRELEPDPTGLVQWSRDCFRLLQQFATEHHAYVVTGSMSREPTPLDLRTEGWNYNSAYVFPPDGSPPGRYDKVHVVPFGEAVPFRFGWLRFLYIWLNNLSPYGQGGYEYSLVPGSEFRVFEMRAGLQADRVYRFGVPICYEDVMPYVSRRFVIGPNGKKRVDFLLNISNDGWFLHSNELPQHLAICAFRAVENRVGIARAVNTGISGFIDADGRIHDLVTDVRGRYHGPGIEGYSVSTVDVDSRCSLYSRIGDVFAVLCCVLWGLAYLDYFVARTLGVRGQRWETESS
jgi:apolipoprotein N-acyltransferase